MVFLSSSFVLDRMMDGEVLSVDGGGFVVVVFTSLE
jgi:hypothetical protein